LKGIYKFIAERMGKAYFPIHTPEERKLFSLHMAKGSTNAEIIEAFKSNSDGRSIFPKLPEHISMYKKIWREKLDIQHACNLLEESKMHNVLRKDVVTLDTLEQMHNIDHSADHEEKDGDSTHQVVHAVEDEGDVTMEEDEPENAELPCSPFPNVPPIASGMASSRIQEETGRNTVLSKQTEKVQLKKKTRGVDKRRRKPRTCKLCQQSTCKGAAPRGKCNKPSPNI
jgi:hypothetical protein